jgi:3-hydroxyisobutyrate dehydrogenase
MALMILPLMLVTTLQRVLAPAMGQKVVHCGEVGTGQIAKLCNNLILGITMAGVAEAFQMGKALGIDPKKLAEVVNTSSGRYASRASTATPKP